MGKGVLQCVPYVVIIYFGSFNLFHCSPLPLYSQSPIIQQLSMYNLTSSTFTDVMFYYITDALSSTFPFLLSPSSLLQTCSTYAFAYNHGGFVHMFIFCVCLPCMRGNMLPLSFWVWFTLLNMMSFNCIHLPSNHMFMAESYSIIYLYHIFFLFFDFDTVLFCDSVWFFIFNLI
jgi:hypothetical protein